MQNLIFDFGSDDEPPPMDQSTPSFPKDQNFHHVPYDDGPSRQQDYKSTSGSNGANANRKMGSSSNYTGPSKSGKNQNGSSKEDVNQTGSKKTGSASKEDNFDKKLEEQSSKKGGQSDPLSSLESIGDLFNK